jgi:hypothetical protein
MINEGGHARVVPEDVGEEEEEEEVGEPVDLIDGETGAKGKKTPAKKHPRWTTSEDECLCDAWKVICIDPITGANQNYGTYWITSSMATSPP